MSMSPPNEKFPKSTSPPNFEEYILNCDVSDRPQDDWTIYDAVEGGFVDGEKEVPEEKDLRAKWWKIDNQGENGACVGFATARGVLRWHYVENKKIFRCKLPSARFIWMATKETDQLTHRPTTFLEKASTQTKLALRVAQKYGCVLEELLPMEGTLSFMDPGAFYTEAAKLRIHSYHNLKKNSDPEKNIDEWKRWIASRGPLLVRLVVDETWYKATENGGDLKKFSDSVKEGGHAVCIVGYTPEHFIVRNSWGEDWGDRGFGYATNDYIEAAFTEAYGVTMDGDGKPPSTGGGDP